MRQRFRKLIEDEISRTVDDPADVAQELEHLLSLLGR